MCYCTKCANYSGVDLLAYQDISRNIKMSNEILINARYLQIVLVYVVAENVLSKSRKSPRNISISFSLLSIKELPLERSENTRLRRMRRDQ